MTIARNDPRVLEYQAKRTTKRRRDQLLALLLRENEPLLRRLIAKYKHRTSKADWDDLMQAGRLAFAYALDRVDPAKTFSTYLAYRVWHEVGRVSGAAETVRFPKALLRPERVTRAIERFEAAHGRKPEPAEIEVDHLDYVDPPLYASLPDDDKGELPLSPTPGEERRFSRFLRENHEAFQRIKAGKTDEERAEIGRQEMAKLGIRDLADVPDDDDR